MGNIGESVGSNQSSVVGNYSEIKDGQAQSSNNMVTSNISVKKSMLKISAGPGATSGGGPGGASGAYSSVVDNAGNGGTQTDIRDRDMDMSPKSSKNEGLGAAMGAMINFHQKY